VPWFAGIDSAIQQDTSEMLRQASAREVLDMDLTDHDIADLVAFLNALTGVSAEDRPLGRPEKVPSGLQVD
jgi:cytochrome c peroxidase